MYFYRPRLILMLAEFPSSYAALFLVQDGLGELAVAQITPDVHETGQENFLLASPTLVQNQEEQKAEGERLLEQGLQQRQAAQDKEATQSFQQALEQYRASGDRVGEGRALIQLGDALTYLGNYQQALDYYEQALTISRELQDQGEELFILRAMSLAASQSSKPGQALELLQQAEVILQANFPTGALRQFQEAALLLVRGNIYRRQGNPQQVIQSLKKGLANVRDPAFQEELLRSNPDVEAEMRNLEAGMLLGLAQSYANTGQNQAALEALQTALSIARSSGNWSSAVQLLEIISLQYTSLGKHQEAIEPLQTALSIVRRVGARSGEARILQLLGASEISLGQYQRGWEDLRQAEASIRETDDLAGLGNTLAGLASVYLTAGEYQQAIVTAQEIVTLGQDTSSPTLESLGLTVLFSVYGTYLGQLPQAGQFSQQALEIAQKTSDQSAQISALNQLGDVYSSLGQYEEANQRYQKALEIANINNLVGQKVDILYSLSQLYLARKDSQQAIACLQQASEAVKETNNPSLEAKVLFRLGTTYSNLKQYPQALELLQKVLVLARQSGDRLLEQNVTYWLSSVYFTSNQYSQSIEYATQAQAIAQEQNNQLSQVVALFAKGLAMNKLDQYAEAEALQFSGLELLESIRGNVVEDTSQIAVLTRHSSFYKILQSTLVNQNKIEQALEVAERERAQALVKLLSSRAATSNAIAQNAGQPESTLPSINLIKQIAQQQNATLVEYTLAGNDDNPRLYIYVVQPNGNVKFQSVSLSQESLAELVTTSRTAIGVRGRKLEATITVEPTEAARQQQQVEQRQPLQRLYQLLIQPIAQDLPQNESDRIVFIPQGDLFLVPFPALMDANGKYLIEQHTISTAPSIQVLGLTHASRQHSQDGKSPLQSIDPANILIVGNPTMPFLPALIPRSPPTTIRASRCSSRS